MTADGKIWLMLDDDGEPIAAYRPGQIPGAVSVISAEPQGVPVLDVCDHVWEVPFHDRPLETEIEYCVYQSVTSEAAVECGYLIAEKIDRFLRIETDPDFGVAAEDMGEDRPHGADLYKSAVFGNDLNECLRLSRHLLAKWKQEWEDDHEIA